MSYPYTVSAKKPEVEIIYPDSGAVKNISGKTKVAGSNPSKAPHGYHIIMRFTVLS